MGLKLVFMTTFASMAARRKSGQPFGLTRQAPTWRDVLDSDDDVSKEFVLPAPVFSDSKSYSEGGLSSLDNSQASLNKRLASDARLDDSTPTDFRFMLQGTLPKQRRACSTSPRDSVDEGLDVQALDESEPNKELQHSIADIVETLAMRDPPASFNQDGIHWVSSGVSKGSDLVDGQAWIAEFERKLTEARSDVQNDQVRELPLRNRVLKDMAKVSPPGRKVELSTGEEVIFWFNVGPAGPPRSRVYVTEARCPHQHVCLLGAELLEIEDLGNGRQALTRCPRHNKRYDLKNGESMGNAEKLRCFPCRFEHGMWYVGVGPAIDHLEGAGSSELDLGIEAQHNGASKPACKRSRLSIGLEIDEDGQRDGKDLSSPEHV